MSWEIWEWGAKGDSDPDEEPVDADGDELDSESESDENKAAPDGGSEIQFQPEAPGVDEGDAPPERASEAPDVVRIQLPDETDPETIIEELLGPSTPRREPAGAALIKAVDRQSFGPLHTVAAELQHRRRDTHPLLVAIPHHYGVTDALIESFDTTLLVASNKRAYLPVLRPYLPGLFTISTGDLGSARVFSVDISEDDPDSPDVHRELRAKKGEPLHELGAVDFPDYYAFAAPPEFHEVARRALDDLGEVIYTLETDAPVIQVVGFVFDEAATAQGAGTPLTPDDFEFEWNGGQSGHTPLGFTPSDDAPATDTNGTGDETASTGGDTGTTSSTSSRTPDSSPSATTSSDGRDIQPSTAPDDEGRQASNSNTTTPSSGQTPEHPHGEDGQSGQGTDGSPATDEGESTTPDDGTTPSPDPPPGGGTDEDSSTDQPPTPDGAAPDASTGANPDGGEAGTAPASGNENSAGGTMPDDSTSSASRSPAGSDGAASNPSSTAPTTPGGDDGAPPDEQPSQQPAPDSAPPGSRPTGSSPESSTPPRRPAPDEAPTSATSASTQPGTGIDSDTGDSDGNTTRPSVDPSGSSSPPEPDPESLPGVPGQAPDEDDGAGGDTSAPQSGTGPDTGVPPEYKPGVVAITEHVLNEVALHAAVHDEDGDSQEIYGTLYANPEGVVRYYNPIDSEEYVLRNNVSVVFKPAFKRHLKELARHHKEIDHRLAGDAHSHPTSGVPKQSSQDKSFNQRVWSNERNTELIVGISDGSGPDEWTLKDVEAEEGTETVEARKEIAGKLVRIRAYSGTNAPKDIEIKHTMGG